ncbi:MAG: ribosome recycling factor [Bdellovibrionaceae bacterium]|nr:ribosome recycling factor [Pseudobdellovibrionaceae bacterium]MDW8190981.1 ribosome recycling factor [Pseudobdellovibrionaceae bacterium]
MELNHIKTKAQERMDKALIGFQNELKKIRTGRAQVDMLDGVRVNYYGQLTPLNQVAAISTPDARSFLISPWESSILKEIEQAIVKSDLGLAPINDGKVIRLKVPELTEERRKDLVKQAKKLAEEAKVGIRLIRRDANEEIKALEKNKKISEDEAKRFEAEIQKVTDEHIKKIDQILSEKEKSIMNI